jgi:hypothetical protein
MGKKEKQISIKNYFILEEFYRTENKFDPYLTKD